MFLAFYNKAHVGDTLLLLKKETTENVSSESKGDVTRVFNTKTNETLAYNIFNASSYVSFEKDGQQFLTQEAVDAINRLLDTQNFEHISVDNTPKFVVGLVEECVDHPDSDHLHVTKVNVGGGEVLQIVCGASNVAAGQQVVVAKIGAVMPSGLIIEPGQLRGVDSNGMLCSARELGLVQDNSAKGILVLDNRTIGEPFFN
ncbi:DUF4479 and tRNA-binding domain-containing protein [Carnobacteriaceae bacterium zg-ZUI252]|nr:DUF4479 and tRNA-binding domain-containing protein [Carnobacteriaceae bacterium zg-ZUI252]